MAKKKALAKVVELEFETAAGYRWFHKQPLRVGSRVEGGWQIPADSAAFYEALSAAGGRVIGEKNPKAKKDKKISGYSNCPCRDCFDVAMDGDLCNLCEDAGCDKTGHSECSRDPEENPEEELTQCACGKSTRDRCQNISSFPGPSEMCLDCRRFGCTASGKCRVQEDNMEAEDRRNPEKAWKTIQYGVLPTKKDFSFHWDDHMGDRLYKIKAGNARGLVREYDGEYTEQQLWDVIANLISNYNAGEEDMDEAGDLASAILGTLGFEWV